MLTQQEKDDLFKEGYKQGTAGSDRATTEPGAFEDKILIGFAFGGPVGFVASLFIPTPQMPTEKQSAYDAGYNRGLQDHQKDLVQEARAENGTRPTRA